MQVYDFNVNTLTGKEESLSKYKDKVVLIVNTASKCGLTPQYKELQELYNEYSNQGLEILGFPCNQFGNQEQGSSDEIESFCSINYGVTFPMFEKINVNGEQAHPLYTYLCSEAPGLLGSKAIKWNFTKFLVDRQGNVVQRFSPQTVPSKFKSTIEGLL